MALDVTEIRELTRDILYGTGLGEKPALIVADSTATVSGGTVSFDVTDGDVLSAGDVLSTYNATDQDSAYAFYILSISSDTVTCVNGYEGPSIANSTDLTGEVFEVMPLVNQWKLYEAAQVVVDRFLWPEVFEITTDTIASPDLTNGQNAMDSRDEEILDAWQVVGPWTVPISFLLTKHIDTSLFPSGKMGSFDYVDASTCYYSAKRRITIADGTASSGLNLLIATGAAAISLGGTVVETTLDSSKKDAQDRGQRDVSAMLWRDFLTQKQVYSEDLSRDTVTAFVIERN